MSRANEEIIGNKRKQMNEKTINSRSIENVFGFAVAIHKSTYIIDYTPVQPLDSVFNREIVYTFHKWVCAREKIGLR